MSTHFSEMPEDRSGDRSWHDLVRQFEEAGAASELQPLPRGDYRCRITGGELVSSKSGTPGYALTFTVEEGAHKGRCVWERLWLTPAAMPMTKRCLARLGVTSLDMLRKPLPRGIVCVVKVALWMDDAGQQRNVVKAFTVVKALPDDTADVDFP
jgi:hypothetical protein